MNDLDAPMIRRFGLGNFVWSPLEVVLGDARCGQIGAVVAPGSSLL